MYGKSNMETYITICKIDSQQEFAVWFSIAALQINSSIPFSRFRIYVLVYDIYLSLSDLLHSV